MTDPELPDCDEIFAEYFDRWYSDDDRQRKPFTSTRPDIERHSNRDASAADLSPLTEAGVQHAAGYVSSVYEAAVADWAEYLEVGGSPDLEWIAAFDAYWDRPTINELLERSNPAEFSNELLVICCEFGAVLGAVLRSRVPSLEWCYDWPYWESALHHPPTGYRVNVFHWAIKKFSEYGVDDGFESKVRACEQYLNEQVAAG
jgi:hypothetical protein